MNAKPLGNQKGEKRKGGRKERKNEREGVKKRSKSTKKRIKKKKRIDTVTSDAIASVQ